MLKICKLLGVEPLQVFQFEPMGEQYRITSEGHLEFFGPLGWTPAGSSALLNVVNGKSKVIK